MITPEQFHQFIPEFTTELPESYLNTFIMQAYIYMGDYNAVWGKRVRYDLAMAFLTAHFMVRSELVVEEGSNLSPKIITSESVGDVSYNRGGVNKIPENFTEDEFNTTIYGYRFLQLMEQRAIFPLI